MDANIAIAQAKGLRRVAADLDRAWDDFLHGTRTPDKEEFAGEEFAGCIKGPSGAGKTEIPDQGRVVRG